MAGWHHQCNGNGLGQTPGDGEGQGASRAAVHGVIKSWTRLGDWTTTERKEKQNQLRMKEKC